LYSSWERYPLHRGITCTIRCTCQDRSVSRTHRKQMRTHPSVDSEQNEGQKWNFKPSE
ncbi:hypothetical protein PIB30_099420, partial [Stylosanthes scabra]|nr:hypothetical protein [Stylosanthes scabra]